VPGPVRKAMAGVMEKISSNHIPYLRNTYNFHSRYYKLKGFLKDVSPARLMRSAVQAFTDIEIKQVMSGETNEVSTKLSSKELKQEYYEPLSYMLAVDYQTYMCDDILQKVDRATMSVSLEGREPFLDQNIIEWAAQLPSEYKYRNGEKKFLLKEIVYRHLPKQMMDRPKMGFGIPIEHWLLNELKDLVNDYLSEDKIKSHGFFNYEAIQELKNSFFSGHLENHHKIWYLLMFQMWHNHWMRTL
jgi:asparagine synthase (glutamine-hydrolysing)